MAPGSADRPSDGGTPEPTTGAAPLAARRERSPMRTVRGPFAVPAEPSPDAHRADGRPSPDGRERDRDRGPLAFLRELPVLLIVAFGLALLIKTFLVQAFYIPSESMLPTLEIGDRVLVNKVVYRLHPPERGDVIVFEDPQGLEVDRTWWAGLWHWVTEGLGFTASPEKDFIKRVVAVPGETIEIRRCVVYVDGRRLNEPYVNPASPGSCEFSPTRVPEDSLFVMGDNRGNSRDSRFGLGFIPYDRVVGRAFVTIWPPSRVGWIQAG